MVIDQSTHKVREQIAQVIRNFYGLAFRDVIIGHFFWGKDHEHLIAAQYDFTCSMLGIEGAKLGSGLAKVSKAGNTIAPQKTASSRSLVAIHGAFQIRNAHFNRRKVLLKKCLDESQLPPSVQKKWIVLEEQLRTKIVNS